MNNEISIWNGYPVHGDIQEITLIRTILSVCFQTIEKAM